MIKSMASYLLLSLCVATALASPIELEARQACPDAYIITARGSNETPGEGTLGAVSQNILSRVPGMSIGVDYIATLDNYEFSQAQGVMVMTDMVKARVNECPEAKIVLMGYSQGAHVVGDTLCGSDSNSPLPAEFGKNIAAVIQTGDPAHTIGLPINLGTSTKTGIFPRNDTEACLPYVDVWQSYCDTGDPFCDSGGDINVHFVYIDKYGGAAADFVVSKVQ